MKKHIYTFSFLALFSFITQGQIDETKIIDRYWGISLKETYKPITPNADWRKCAFDFDKISFDKRSGADKTIEAPYHGGMIFRKNHTFEEVISKAGSSQRKASTGTWKFSHDTITVSLSDNTNWYFVVLKASGSRITLKHWWDSNEVIETQEPEE